MADEDFRMEDLLESLQELQQEKEKNEAVLAQECARTKKLEETLDATKLRQSAATAKHAKMEELIRTSEQKAAQVQAQCEQYNDINKAKREKLEDLNNQIAMEAVEQKKNLDLYAEVMSDLTEKFAAAPEIYSEEYVENEIVVTNQKIEKALQQSELYAHEVEELTKRLEELETKEQDSQDASDGCIDEELKKTVLNMFLEENKAVHEAVAVLDNRIASLQSEHKRLEEELKKITDCVQNEE